MMVSKRDASLLPQTDLRKELMKRNKKPSGFWEDDMTTLQREFDREYEEDLAAEDERIELQKKEKMKSEKKKSELRIKRRELFEEEDALAKRPDIKRWMDRVRNGECTKERSIRAHDILSRHILRNLPEDSPLQTLDMSRNDLHDELASFVGDMLKRNKSIRKLELHENNLGPRTLSALSEAMESENNTLTYINLDDNPLLLPENHHNHHHHQQQHKDEKEDISTKNHGEEDLSGIQALGSCLRKNKSLTVLSLNNCGLNRRCGKILADAIETNDTLIMLNTDFSASSMDLADSLRISSKLEKNKYSRSVKIQEQRLQRLAFRKQKEIQDKIDEEKRKAEEEAKWIEKQRVERCEKRKKDAEDAERKRLEEEKAKEDERKRKEEAAKAASKKKGKKKGKKKKKKKKK